MVMSAPDVALQPLVLGHLKVELVVHLLVALLELRGVLLLLPPCRPRAWLTALCLSPPPFASRIERRRRS